jgi:hypothetical protein
MTTPDHSALDRMIASIRQMPELGKRAAPDVAHALEAALQTTIAAGKAPDGTAWQLTKTGDVPLTGAAKVLGVAAVGPVIYMRLRGPEARHHLGRARGGVVRPIIPTGALPPDLVKVIDPVLDRHFKAIASGVGV